MNEEIFLNNYIASERTQRLPKNVSAADNVHKIFEVIKTKYFSSLQLSLSLCHSYDKECCTIKILDKNFLLFDTYLLEIFRSLNYFYCNDVFFSNFFYRLFGENFLCNNNIILACSFFERINQPSKIKFDHDPLQNLTTIQIWFILAHEFSHIIYRRDCNIKSQLEDLFMSVNSPTILEYVRTHTGIVEECFCDRVALEIVYSELSNKYSLEEIGNAVIYAFQHIRTLAIVNEISNDKKFNVLHNNSVFGDFLTQATIRIIYASRSKNIYNSTSSFDTEIVELLKDIGMQIHVMSLLELPSRIDDLPKEKITKLFDTIDE